MRLFKTNACNYSMGSEVVSTSASPLINKIQVTRLHSSLHIDYLTRGGGVPGVRGGGVSGPSGGVPGVQGGILCPGGVPGVQGVYLVSGGYLVWGVYLVSGGVPGIQGVYLVPGGVPGVWGVYLVPGGPGPGGDLVRYSPPCEQNDKLV